MEFKNPIVLEVLCLYPINISYYDMAYLPNWNTNILFSNSRSDIQYSIDDDTESLHKDMDPESATNRTPIIKPSSGKMFNSNGNSSDLLKGSENSLLNMTDEDMWLRKGMYGLFYYRNLQNNFCLVW